MDHETRDCNIRKGSMHWPGKCPLTPENWSFLQQKYHLSPKELGVAICVCSGCNNKEVAQNLGVELNTAKLYIRNLYFKVGVNNKIMLLLNFISDVS